MGTWGTGNFDDNTASDGLSELMSSIIDKINEEFEDDSNLEPDEWGGCMVPAWL